MTWAGSIVLGVWLSLAAVWPAVRVSIGKTGLLWQPFFLLSLLSLAVIRHRRIGWAAAIG